jgi:hypothetical protein
MFSKIIEDIKSILSDYKYVICYEKIEKNLITDKVLERQFYYAKTKEDAEIFRDYLLAYYNIKLNKDTIISSTKKIREIVYIANNNSFRLNQYYNKNIYTHMLLIIDFRCYSDIFYNILVEPYLYFEELTNNITKEYMLDVYKNEITNNTILVVGYECKCDVVLLKKILYFHETQLPLLNTIS